MNMMYASNNCYAEGQEASFGAPHYEVNVEKLAEVFGRQSVNAFSFLLDRVDTTTLSEFLTLFVNRERQAQMATATIIVRKTEKGIRRTGNTGLFQIFVQTSDGEVKLVHFTNQISTIYYLLHLIDRRQKQGELPPLHLGGNKDTFVELYHAVYDNISHDEVVRRFRRLDLPKGRKPAAGWPQERSHLRHPPPPEHPFRHHRRELPALRHDGKQPPSHLVRTYSV